MHIPLIKCAICRIPSLLTTVIGVNDGFFTMFMANTHITLLEMALAYILFNSRFLSASKHTRTHSASWEAHLSWTMLVIVGLMLPVTLPQFGAVSIKFHLYHHVPLLYFTSVSKEAAVGERNCVYQGKCDGEGSLARVVCKIQRWQFAVNVCGYTP